MGNNNEYKGSSLFNDIEDVSLRDRNRAVILTNELESGFSRGKLSSRAAAFILGYFSQVPAEERKTVRDTFIKLAAERGFQLS